MDDKETLGQAEAPQDPRAVKVREFLDRLLLRIFNSSPGAACYLIATAHPEPGTIELAFHELPAEIARPLKAELGCKDCEQLEFRQDGQPCLGFRLKPSDAELGGLPDGEETVDITGTEPKNLPEKPDDQKGRKVKASRPAG